MKIEDMNIDDMRDVRLGIIEAALNNAKKALEKKHTQDYEVSLAIMGEQIAALLQVNIYDMLQERAWQHKSPPAKPGP